MEAPVLDSPLPALMPDESDSYCAITSTVNGKGPFAGAMRDSQWLITARHAILGDRALNRYAPVLYVKKGNCIPVRIHVVDSVILLESEKITDLEAFGCSSGHDLIALKIADADTIVSQLQIKSQQLFYPLASGTMMVKGHFGVDGKPHVSHGTLFEVPEDRVTGTIHHTASSYAGMSGSPLFCRHRGRTVVCGTHLGTWSSEKGFATWRRIITLCRDCASCLELLHLFQTPRLTRC